MKTKTLVLVAIAIAVAMFGFSSISSAADTTYYGASLAKSFDELAASGARQIEFSGSKFRLAPILAGMPYSASNVKCYAMYTEGNTLYVARRVSGKLLFLPYNGEPYAPYYDIVSFDGNSWTPDAFDYLGASGVSVAGKSFVFGIAPETIVTLDEFIKTFSGDWISFVTPTSSTGIANNPDTVPILWIDDSTGLLPTTSSTATITAIIGENGGKAITARGACYGKIENPDRDNGTCVASTTNIGLDTFTTSLTGLSSSTLYHARAYATNSVGTNYSQDVKFATSAPVPGETPTTALSVKINTIVSSGTVAVASSTVTPDSNGAVIIAKGLCYSTTANPSFPGVADATGPTCIPDNTVGNTFSTTMPPTTGTILKLEAGKTYHARAYAVDGSGTTYSQDYVFNMSALAQIGPPVVYNKTAVALGSGNERTATVVSTIISDSPITAAGVCYATTTTFLDSANAYFKLAIANPGTTYSNGAAIPDKVACTLVRSNQPAGELTFSTILAPATVVPAFPLTSDPEAYQVITYATNSAGTAYSTKSKL